MIKILKNLKQSWLAIVLIFILLIVQAFCDLSLPQYTSDIVDVGIQNSGIDSPVPVKLSTTEMDKLFLFMNEDDKANVLHNYTIDEDYYVLVDTSGKTKAELYSAFNAPSAIVYSLSNPEMMSAMMPSDNEKKMPDGMDFFDMLKMMPAEQSSKMISEITDKFSEVSDMMLDQMSIKYVTTQYEQSGIDLVKMQKDYLTRSAFEMILIALVLTAASIVVTLFASRASALLGMTLRSRIFKKVISFSNSEMDMFSTASLITRSTNDIQQIQLVVVLLLRMVLYAPILGIGGIIKVSSTKTGLGWIIGVAVGAVLALVIVLITVAMPKFKKMQDLVDRLNLVAREILTGLPVIRAFSREEHEEERFDVANQNLKKTQLFTNRTMTFMFPAMMLIMNGVTVLILWVGGHGIDEGNLQVGDMMAFITYTMQIIMSFLMLTMISIMLPRAAVSAKRINEVLESEPSVKDKEKVVALNDAKGEICFDDVNFRYYGADEDVLEHISFTAKPGQTTAIIGSTGSGKSTLINLIPRFFDVTNGKITLDGVDIRDISQKNLREEIGFIPQKAVLFSGTIESNLKFGNINADRALVEKSAEIAQSADFINEKEEGYESPIAQGGSNVSGGQKQRLSIARAIVKQPKVYVFDDSFSALDYKTDVALRKALNENVSNATVIIVAQRISTILNADQIIVLDEGKIAGIGTHKELMKNCEVYEQIAKSQLSDKELSDNQEGGE